MWKYEVAWTDKDGIYRWKGFGYADKFEAYIRRLVKKGMKIVSISDWDSEGIGAKLKAEYIG